MALKDLTISHNAIAEEVIEEIISAYVRFDPEQKLVVFTPESDGLGNRAKVLIFLVALQGWPYVLDDVIPTDAKPAEIEDRTNISGGTLRPLLKELKDRKVILERGGRYSVRSMALRSIKAELDGRPTSDLPKPNRRKRFSRPPPSTDADPKSEIDTPQSGAARVRKRASNGGLAEKFEKWVGNGFFNNGRTLSEVQNEFHKEAIIVPQTSIPGYLLQAVRSGHLTREKQDVNGKSVWVYKTKAA